MLKIATWNVNSIKARNDQLLAWLGKYSPDSLCLQKLKVEDAAFPLDAVREAGSAERLLQHFGQKSPGVRALDLGDLLGRS